MEIDERIIWQWGKSNDTWIKRWYKIYKPFYIKEKKEKKMKDYRHYFKILFYESVLNDLMRHYIIEYKPRYYKDKIKDIFKKIKIEIEKEMKDDLL